MHGEPDPDLREAVVVYRTDSASVLMEARAALFAAGLGCATPWREPVAHGEGLRGDGEVLVRPEDAPRAREVLAAYEARSAERVRAHLRQLPGDLRRFALLLGLAFLAVFSFTGAWTGAPWRMGIAAGSLAILALFEVSARVRRRDRVPPRRG